MSSEISKGEIELYQSVDGSVRVECRLEDSSVLLTQRLMAELFEKDVRTISEHLQNVFDEGELERPGTIRKFRIVRTEGSREVLRQVEHYNLDAILSVGYRVNSRRGTQFRIWATQTLRDHLVRGYTLSEPRLLEEGLNEIQQAVALLGKTLRRNELVADDGRAVLDIIEAYTTAWHLLPAFDAGKLSFEPMRPREPSAQLTVFDARSAVDSLRRAIASRAEPTDLFGREHGQQLAGILGAVEQTFDGAPVYPSVQARAAHLLYFVVKDHPFVDGNKRIGALLFLEYLQRHDLLRRDDGSPRLDANAIVALTLLIAESDPRQKGLMIRLVLGMLDDGGLFQLPPNAQASPAESLDPAERAAVDRKWAAEAKRRRDALGRSGHHSCR